MTVIKWIIRAIALAITFPAALLTGFGRIEPLFELFAHILALGPGLPGSYLRVAYYFMTLRSCSLDNTYIGIGSFFAHPQALVGRQVYIGAFCVLGQTNIGDKVQIASGVQILSGRRQHSRDDHGEILGSEAGGFQAVSIGANCWIGAGAIVMSDIGEKTTIGAGSVVTNPIPAGSVAVGNPARIIKSVAVHV